MIKPPVVFVVGALRSLGLGVTSARPSDYLSSMGQVPVLPADRGGLGGRPLVAQHEYRAGALRLRRRRIGNAPNGSPAKVVDVPARRRRRPSTARTAPSARPWL